MGRDPMGVVAVTTTEPFDPGAFYQAFNERETDATGTVVLHHGKIKHPGKQIENFHHVVLETVVEHPERALRSLGERAASQYGLHQVMVVHRLGVVGRGDDVLLVIVSAATREKAFQGCARIVDAIKGEEVIRLVEKSGPCAPSSARTRGLTANR